MPTINRKKIIPIDTLIISDIHLGDHSTRCDKVLEVLSQYKYDRLVLNGDILNGLNLKRLHTGHWKVLSQLRKISKKCEVVWVRGNHDADNNSLSQLLGLKVTNKHFWDENGKKYLAIHGHQFDRFMHDNIILSLAAFSIYHLLKKVIGAGFLINLIRSKNKTWMRNSREVANGAIAYARLFKADAVFCGHIHMIDTAKSAGIAYYNTGCWVESPSAYAVIADGKIELIKVA
jgi:UDP-2,3-diacylglucosamine pyrophosphatase LpxH